MSNLPYLIALNQINGAGPKTITALRRRWPDLSTLFALNLHQMHENKIPFPIAQQIHSFNLESIEYDLDWATQESNHILTIEDDRYPALLKEIADPPTVLYAKGNINALNLQAIAVIGSRKPSINGENHAFEFAKALSLSNLAIVSGLALGIDAKAHQGCLQAQGSTIAVMGTGLQHIYPRRHLKLAQEICENGLLISEFPLITPPKAGHFPRRNRIISGLSLATLVVEATIKSGSLITARLALEQNREVLAIPGSIHNPAARGCHHLLQQGAKLVTRVEDILEELCNHATPTACDSQISCENLATDAQKLVQCLGFDLSTVDELCARSGFSLENTTTHLAQLELLGLVKTVMGGYIKV